MCLVFGVKYSAADQGVRSLNTKHQIQNTLVKQGSRIRISKSKIKGASLGKPSLVYRC